MDPKPWPRYPRLSPRRFERKAVFKLLLITCVKNPQLQSLSSLFLSDGFEAFEYFMHVTLQAWMGLLGKSHDDFSLELNHRSHSMPRQDSSVRRPLYTCIVVVQLLFGVLIVDWCVVVVVVLRRGTGPLCQCVASTGRALTGDPLNTPQAPGPSSTTPTPTASPGASCISRRIPLSTSHANIANYQTTQALQAKKFRERP